MTPLRTAIARKRGEQRARDFTCGLRAYFGGWPRTLIDTPDYRRGWDAGAARDERSAS